MPPIPYNLKTIRNLKGLSQRELEVVSKVSKKSIERAESGINSRGTTVRRLAKALGTSVEELCENKAESKVAAQNNFILKQSKIRYTPEQSKAINHEVKNLQIISGAGAGKTQILAEKVSSLILDHGISPNELVALTFTTKAATELKHRIRKIYLTREGNERGLDDMFVGTIHAWCMSLIEEHLPEYLKFDLLDGMEQFLFVQRHYKKIFPQNGMLQTNKNGTTKISSYSATLRIATRLFNILREAKVNQSKVSHLDGFEALKRYEKLMFEQKKLDFSMLLNLVSSKVIQDEGFRKNIIEGLRYLIVDEYQDTNFAQEQILKNIELVGRGEICLTVVGDDDQLIYGWNNALNENMLEFEKRYPSVDRITLPHNFRSSVGVLDCAYRIVEQNGIRIDKNYEAASHHDYEEGDVLALTFDSIEGEGLWIASKISKMLGLPYLDKPNSIPRGISYSDIAILVRTKGQAYSLVKELENQGIPYNLKGGPGLLSTSSIGEAAAAIFFYLAEFKGSEIFEYDDLVESWSKANLGLSDEKIMQAITAIDEFKDSWSLMIRHSKKSLQEAFKIFLSELDLSEESIPEKVVSPYCSHGEFVFSILGQFSRLIAKFENVNFGYDASLIFRRFAEFLYYSADNLFEENIFYQQKAIDAVNVMTIHAAKGLEFPVVFMPGMVSNKFPMKRQGGINVFHFIPEDAVKNSEAYKTPRDEERRLAFVGMTRAEKYLFMSWAPIESGSSLFSKPSIFLNEISKSDYVLHNDFEDNLKTKRITPNPKNENQMVEVDFSHMKLFMACPYSFKLRAEYGFEAGYTEGLGFGNVIHNTFCEYINKIKNDEPINDYVLEKLVDKHFHLPFTTNFDRNLKENMRMSAIERMKKLHRDRYESFKTAIHTEKSVSLLLNDSIRLVGRMDLLRGIHVGKEVVDLKSSYSAQHEDFTKLQLLGYSLGERENTGEPPKRISAIYADKPKSDIDGCEIGSKDLRLAINDNDLRVGHKDLLVLAESLSNTVKPKLPKQYKDSKGKLCTSCDECDVSYICSKGNYEFNH